MEVIDRVANEDHFDYIFLTVKENQVHTALRELRSNCSPNIVTMVNTLEPYGKWEEICGTGRIIPAFPGAGGSFQGDVLKAALTPKAIQPTTFGEINGKKTKRLQEISLLLRKAEIPYQIVKNMHDWQLCHLAMVVPIADAYYAAEHPKEAWKEKAVMLKTARQLKHNFKTLHALGIHLSPWKMNLFCFAPVWILKAGMESPMGKAFFAGKAKTVFTWTAQQKRAAKAVRDNAAPGGPFNWQAEIILGRDTEEYTIRYRQCGLCALGRQEGLPHLVPYLCALDTLSIDWMGGALYRTKTLATGGDCCDFYICKKDSKWIKQEDYYAENYGTSRHK